MAQPSVESTRSMMNSLALTDAFLFAVCASGVLRADLKPALRLGCAVLAAASVLGVLRFSEIYPLPSLHSFFSMLGAMSALPLLALSIVVPDSQVASRVGFAWIFFVATAATGVVAVTLAGQRWVSDAAALVSALSIVMSAGRRHQWAIASLGLTLLASLLVMAFKWQVNGVFQSADFLHVGLAVFVLCTMQISYLSTRSTT